MSKIANLETGHFSLVGNKLKISTPKPILVFFKMSGCPGCAKYAPVFNSLAQQSRGILYGVLDVVQHRGVVQLANSTSNTKIQTVPQFIFFKDGVATAKYRFPATGNMDVNDFTNFVSTCIGLVGGGYSEPQEQQPSGYGPKIGPKALRQNEKGGGKSINGYHMINHDPNNPDAEDPYELSCPDCIPSNQPWRAGEQL